MHHSLASLLFNDANVASKEKKKDQCHKSAFFSPLSVFKHAVSIALSACDGFRVELPRGFFRKEFSGSPLTSQQIHIGGARGGSRCSASGRS